MEIIKLLLLILGYYYLEFYKKILLIIGSCLFVSLSINQKSIESKSNEPNQIFYYILNSLILSIFKLYDTFVYLLKYSIRLPVISNIYSLLEFINYYYLQGRNKIFEYMMNNAVDIAINAKFSNKNIINTNKSIIKDDNQKSTFKDDDELNNFLDSLINKEKNY